MPDRGLSDLIERVPDEFYNWVRDTEADLLEAFVAIEQHARSEMRFDGSRKELAEYYKTCKYPGVMFSMLDNKNYQAAIWKMIKPKGQAVFKMETE